MEEFSVDDLLLDPSFIVDWWPSPFHELSELRHQLSKRKPLPKAWLVYPGAHGKSMHEKLHRQIIESRVSVLSVPEWMEWKRYGEKDAMLKRLLSGWEQKFEQQCELLKGVFHAQFSLAQMDSSEFTLALRELFPKNLDEALEDRLKDRVLRVPQLDIDGFAHVRLYRLTPIR